MNNLTATELKVINNLSQEQLKSVKLGDKVQALISSLGKAGTPVNAVNATMVLTVSSVVVDGETVSINNPAVAGADVYEFLADAAQSKTAAGNIAVNIAANATKASGTLTVDTQPTSGDTVTIGTKVYTFVPVGTANADGEVSIGANLAGAQAALVAAINGTDGVSIAHPLVSAGNFAANACTITALVGGTAGNSIATTETFTAGTNIFAAATLGSGTNCSAANAITALAAAINASDTQGVGATAGSGIVTLTADTAGVAGNAIIIAETMANGSFTADAVLLAGGVNGTVGLVGSIQVDASYIYTPVADNTISGKNWRRVSLGSAY